MIILPSLEIVPAKFNGNILLSQIPVNGTGDFTVSRATSPTTGQSTRVNALGQIELVADNVPRLDYLQPDGTIGCPALLVEPSAQNLVLRSQELDVSPTWSLVIGGTGLNPAITTNAVISPDGTQNAERIVLNRGAGNTISDQSTLQQSITIPTTGAYIFSVYAKASTAGDVGKQVFLRIGGAGSLTAITLTANWVRYSRAESSVTSGSQAVQIGNRGTVTADNSVSVDLWGAQAEAGAIATSYIPTTVSGVTRAADVITDTTASGVIGQVEGTVYCEFVNSLVASYAEGYVYRVFADANNEIWARKEGGGNTYSFRWRANSANTTFSNVAVPNGVSKIAFGYKSGDTALFLNGSQVATTNTDVRAFSVNPTTIALGSTSSGQFFNDRIRAAALYPTRLTNTQLALLTSPYTSYSSMASALSYTLG